MCWAWSTCVEPNTTLGRCTQRVEDSEGEAARPETEGLHLGEDYAVAFHPLLTAGSSPTQRQERRASSRLGKDCCVFLRLTSELRDADTPRLFYHLIMEIWEEDSA